MEILKINSERVKNKELLEGEMFEKDTERVEMRMFIKSIKELF